MSDIRYEDLLRIEDLLVEIAEHLKDIKKQSESKTYPHIMASPITEDKVCMELSRFLTLPVVYNENIRMFLKLTNNGHTEAYVCPEIIDLEWLPRNLISMIGKFFEHEGKRYENK